MRWVRGTAAVLVAAVFGTACSGVDPVPTAATSVPAASSTTGEIVPPTGAPVTAPVPSSTAPPQADPPTPTDPPTAVYDFSDVDPVVAAFVADRGLDGAALVIVDRDDGIVYEGYWGEFGPDRVSFVASSSKMITAGVLLRLHDRGLLDVDAPIVDYVDWATDNPDITVAQLLSNSSGLVGLGPNPAYLPYACQWLPNSELERCGERAFETSLDDGDVVAPDTEFRYGGVQWQIAGAVAETVSGASWSALIEETYVEPCGVTSLGYNNHWLQVPWFDYPFYVDIAELSPTENPNLEGGAYITPPDYAELLLMHLREGECPGGRVVSPESIARMHTDRVLAEYGDAGQGSLGYGMGWWVDRRTGQISDGGAYGSLPWLDVADGYGAFLLIEADSSTGGELGVLLNPIVEAAMTD